MEEIALGILRVGKAEKLKARGRKYALLGVPQMEYRVCLEEEQKAESVVARWQIVTASRARRRTSEAEAESYLSTNLQEGGWKSGGGGGSAMPP